MGSIADESTMTRCIEGTNVWWNLPRSTTAIPNFTNRAIRTPRSDRGEVIIDLLGGGNVALAKRKNVRRNVTDSEVRKALNAADSAYDRLIALWEKTH